MNVTEVVRGCDLLSSVVAQRQLYDMLHAAVPTYYHVPLLVASDGRRLSKRDGDLDMGALRKRFSSPEPIIGYLLHAAGILDRFEPISLPEAATVFDWKRVTRENIVIDHARLYSKGDSL